MYSVKITTTFLLILVVYSTATLFPSSSPTSKILKAFRLNIPMLGVGVSCNGCPGGGCEDDPAVVHGYCCGCAYAADVLPVLCADFLQCPLNLHGLCHDYEYMMRCCC